MLLSKLGHNGRGTSSTRPTSPSQTRCQTSQTWISPKLAGQRWESWFLIICASADLNSRTQASKDASNANNGASDASEPNLQSFLDNFVCQSNQMGVKYYFFEFFDEKWKDDTFGGVEGHWGLFYQKYILCLFSEYEH